MDMSQLAQQLKYHGISSRHYRFGQHGAGFSDDSFLIEPRDGSFDVLYMERGKASLLASFSSEDAACSYLFKQLTQDDSFKIRAPR
ncbi:hypothetical protein J2S80_003413 [Pseudoxanthomonas mexicana]|nr:hypothetical protein [Pseudoxanthomonas mexicana]